MTSTRAAVALAAIAVALIVAGVAMLAGPGWAMITAGMLAAAAAVLLYDPNPDKPGKARR